MAVFTYSHMQHPASLMSEAVGSHKEAATPQPTEGPKQAGTGVVPDAGLQPVSTSMIAIAGHDPAVLQIWDLQVLYTNRP